MNETEKRIMDFIGDREVPADEVMREIMGGIDYYEVQRQYLAYREALFGLLVTRQEIVHDWNNNLRKRVANG